MVTFDRSIICSTSYLVYFTCKIRRSLVSFCQEETDCYREDVVGLIKRVHICISVMGKNVGLCL